MSTVNDFNPGDRIRVTTSLGPNGGREGTITTSARPSVTVSVVLDGDDSIYYFLPNQLVVIDPAPVAKEYKAPSLNRLLDQLDADNRAMMVVATDVQSYGMHGLSKTLGEEAVVLSQFIAQLRWALRKDGLLEERDEYV